MAEPRNWRRFWRPSACQ